MEKTLAAINRLEEVGIIRAYAIAGAIEPKRFGEIITRHALTAKWERFQKKFLMENE